MHVKLILSLAMLSIFCASPAISVSSQSPPLRLLLPDRAGADMRGPMHGTFRIAPPGIWWKKADLVQKLSLTADQQKRMDDIFQAEPPSVGLISEHPLRSRRLCWSLCLLPIRRTQIRSSRRSIKSPRRALNLKRLWRECSLGIRGVLTPDQWTKLQAEEARSPLHETRTECRGGAEARVARTDHSLRLSNAGFLARWYALSFSIQGVFKDKKGDKHRLTRCLSFLSTLNLLFWSLGPLPLPEQGHRLELEECQQPLGLLPQFPTSSEVLHLRARIRPYFPFKKLRTFSRPWPMRSP